MPYTGVKMPQGIRDLLSTHYQQISAKRELQRKMLELQHEVKKWEYEVIKKIVTDTDSFQMRFLKIDFSAIEKFYER